MIGYRADRANRHARPPAATSPSTLRCRRARNAGGNRRGGIRQPDTTASSVPSVSSVTLPTSLDQPVASIDAALQGKAAGVQVTQNAGNPGNAISVRIRGDASVSASNQPLYVLDGVPMVAGDISQLGLGGQGVAGISGLSLDDVENIDILKDAAAASIYGSRGSNGVVLITTKRGQEGRTNVTFNSFIGTQSAAKRLDLLNSTEYLTFMNQAAANDGYGDDYFGTIGVTDRSTPTGRTRCCARPR